MFACSGSSPAAPALRAMKQTSLNLFSRSRPSTRLARKEAKAGQNEGQAEHAMKEITCSTPKRAPRTSTIEEGWVCLKEAQLIGLECNGYNRLWDSPGCWQVEE